MAHLYLRGRVWWCTYYDHTGRRHLASTRCTDRTAAELAAARLERIAADPAHAAKASATLSTALASFFRQCDDRLAAGTMSAATRRFYAVKAGHLVRLFGPDAALAGIDAPAVRAYLRQRRAEGAVEHTLSKEITTLRQTLRLAGLDGVWDGHVDHVVPPVRAQYSPKTRVLSRCEVRDVLGLLPRHRAAFVAFCVGTGAELQAAVRARRSDVDLSAGAVRLRGTKRPSRARVVPLVMAEARGLVMLALEWATGRDGALFVPWTSVQRDLRAAAVRLGIEHFSPNDLRRTFASWHVAAGVSFATLAPVMGHTTTTMLQLVYGRISAAEIAAKMRRELGEP